MLAATIGQVRAVFRSRESRTGRNSLYISITLNMPSGYARALDFRSYGSPLPFLRRWRCGYVDCAFHIRRIGRKSVFTFDESQRGVELRL